MKRTEFLLLFLVLVITGSVGCGTAKDENPAEAVESRLEINETGQNTNQADPERPASGQEAIASEEAGTEQVQEALVLNKETEHFKIFCTEKDKDCLEDLGKALESAYVKVTADLERKLDYKVDVSVYPDLNSLHASVGLGGTGVDDYMTAASLGKHIYLVSPLNPGPARDYDHIVNSSTFHEFTHVVINDLTSSDTWPTRVPRWLNEGVASYEGGPPMPVEILNQQVALRAQTDKVPSFEDMASYGSKYNEVAAYFFALPAGTYLIEKYGFEKVKELILSPDDFKGVLGKSQEELWNEWKEYLKEKYR